MFIYHAMTVYPKNDWNFIFQEIKCKFDVTLVCVFQLDCRVGHFLIPCIFPAGSYVIYCLCVMWVIGPLSLRTVGFYPTSELPMLRINTWVSTMRGLLPIFFCLCFLIFPLSTQAYDLLVCLFIPIDSCI